MGKGLASGDHESCDIDSCLHLTDLTFFILIKVKIFYPFLTLSVADSKKTLNIIPDPFTTQITFFLIQ